MSRNKINQCDHIDCNKKLIANSKYTFCSKCGVLAICDETTQRLRWLIKSGNCQKVISIDPLEIAIQTKSKRNNTQQLVLKK